MPAIGAEALRRTYNAGVYADTAKMPRGATIAAAYVAGYVALDWISYLYPVAPFAITPWNPPPGLSLAVLLALGLRYAPALFVAAWIAEIVVRNADPLGAVLVAFVLAAGYSAVAAFLARALTSEPRLGTLRDLALFTAAAAVGSLMVAACYVALLAAGGEIGWAEFPGHVERFFIGDFVGIVVTTPFLLACGTLVRAARHVGRPWEVAVEAASIVLALWVIFGFAALDSARFFYLLFVPLVWIAARHGHAGAAAALFAIQAGVIAAVKLAGFSSSSVYELQILMTALAVTGLFLGAAVSERQAAQVMLREREHQLEHALRLAAGSELASALAHELNQPLSAASNYLRASALLLAQPDADPVRLADTMRRAVSEVERAGDVMRRLREFFRSGALRKRRIDLAALVRSADELIRGLDDRGVSLVISAPRHPVQIWVDRLQIELVLRNLLGNAIEAVDGAGERSGTITLALETSRDGFAKVTVRDTGPGISPEIVPRLFDPFSTTKPHGLGLGLAISRSIIDAHGGKLWHEQPPSGAAFSFTLPIVEAGKEPQ